MDVPLSICPKGEGLYSRGSFYWINYTPFDQSGRPKFRFDVAAYKVAEKRWDIIRQPQTRSDVPEFEYEHRCSWRLTGYDGKVVLVDQVDMSLWKLNIEGCEGPSWSEFQAFPKSPYKEIVSLGNFRRADRNPENSGFIWPHPQILINRCEWVLVHLPYQKLVVFDSEGRMIRSVEGRLFSAFGLEGWRVPIHGYEINNIWWP
ncbi:hypothetical protein SUGI_0474090 [Cryptomeria japonica]|nr:hypothetical protein SUGI_0474090 [Cryptomeria japonica]